MRTVRYVTSLREPYYTYVRNGEKTWEIRLNRREWAEVREGDWVLAFRRDGRGEFIIFEVVERREFPSFREALEEVGFNNAVPHAKSVEEALEPYLQFYGEQDREGSVVALKVRTVAEYQGELDPDKVRKYLISFRGERT